MSPTVFELTISASERPQTHTLDRTATEIGKYNTLIAGNSSQTRKFEFRTAKYILSYDSFYCYIVKKKVGKVHPCTGTETLYRPYGL